MKKYCSPFSVTSACVCILFLSYAAECRGQTPPASGTTNAAALRSINIEIAAYSLQPGEGLATYKNHGSGSAGPRGTFGATIQQQGGQRYNATITVRQQDRQFLADFSVKDVTGGKQEKELLDLSESLNLTDLQPRMIEIAKDPDGRVYRINLVPRLVEHPLPKKFRTADLGFEGWTFSNSAVILNDQDYVGSIQMSTDGNSVSWVEIPGLALVEFSLTEMTDSKPEGTLQNGTIYIAHESTGLQIRSVLNGKTPQMLNGPYQVFVRWKNSGQSLEDARTMLKAQISMLKERIEKGDTSFPKEVLPQFEKMAESDRPFLMGSGTRQLQQKEIATSQP